MSTRKQSSIVIYIITLVILILIVLFINPQNLIDSLLHLGSWGLLILCLLYLIDLLVRSYRWKVLLIAQGTDLPVLSLILPVCSALAINLFTIARAGEVVRIFSLKRNHGTKYSDSLSSIVIEQVLSIIGLLIVVTGSLFLIGYSFQAGESSQVIGQLVFLLFLISGVGLLVVGMILIKPDFVHKILTIFPTFISEKLSSAYEALLRGITDLRSHPSLLIQGILTSALVWLIEGLMLYVIAISVFPFFELIDLPWVIAASCAGNITFIVPILPGAMGEYEAVVAIILINSPHYLGIDATLVAFIDRIAKSAILGILGGYATIKLGGKELLRYRTEISALKNNIETS